MKKKRERENFYVNGVFDITSSLHQVVPNGPITQHTYTGIIHTFLFFCSYKKKDKKA